MMVEQPGKTLAETIRRQKQAQEAAKRAAEEARERSERETRESKERGR